MTTTKTNPADVPLWLISDALDELYQLRNGAAYEADVVIATLGMKLSYGCRNELNTAKAVLLDCVRSEVVKHKATTKQVEAWMTVRGQRSFVSDELGPYDLLEHLVGDINFLRRRLSEHPVYALGYSGLPESRRACHREQVKRLTSLTVRKVRDPWAGVSHLSLKHSWRAYGTGLLTRSDYETELDKRW